MYNSFFFFSDLKHLTTIKYISKVFEKSKKHFNSNIQIFLHLIQIVLKKMKSLNKSYIHDLKIKIKKIITNFIMLNTSY